jgi:hypothetical protein
MQSWPGLLASRTPIDPWLHGLGRPPAKIAEWWRGIGDSLEGKNVIRRDARDRSGIDGHSPPDLRSRGAERTKDDSRGHNQNPTAAWLLHGASHYVGANDRS